jgi:hypothetical protein
MNNTTRIAQFQNNSKNLDLRTVIGHGSLIPGNTDFFPLPANKYVIFLSKPGYWISLKVLKQDSMMSLLNSQNKLRLLLTDKLPKNQMPDIIKNGHWNWKKHIYMPGMMCPNMYFELYDHVNTSWGRWYNEQCGVRTVGESLGQLKNLNARLSEITSANNPSGIYFVFGCRGDPNTYQETGNAFRNSNDETVKRQNYRLPPSIPVSRTKFVENLYTRYAGKKRVRGGPTVRKTKNEPPAKRRSVVNVTNSVKKVSRNININRFVKAQYRPGLGNAELRDLVHRKSVLNGKNYTLREITNSIRRLKNVPTSLQ